MNRFTGDEIVFLLEKLGFGNVAFHSRSIRASCGIHHGDNRMGFAMWRDQHGYWRGTCHTQHCVKGSSIEWIARRVLQGTISDAVAWIAAQLNRADLIVTDINRSRELAIQEDAHPQVLYSGDEEELARLRKVHPYHAYWKSRGYSQEMVDEFELTYRSLDYRAIIPMRDANGNLLGMMERSTNGEEPKYKWNSPNPNKGAFLFGVPQALRRPLVVSGRRVVFLVEGTLDGIKATQFGFPVVASQTNRLSAAQAQTLLTHWDLVVCLPDNDPAGVNLIADLEKRLVPFTDVAVFALPEHVKDLDSVPTALIPSILTGALADWKEGFFALNRFQRSKLLRLAF